MIERKWKLAVLICVLGAALTLPGMLKAAPAEDAAAAVSAMEAGLERDPDDLQLGAKYRQTIIQLSQYDRAIGFFEKLVAAHEGSANAHLNYGFAYVDKIPTAGSITQVLLANNALTQFSKSIDLKPTWIGLYSRGNSYMFWPKVFGRTPLGIADLEQCMKMQKADKKRDYYVRTYIALGDGYWKLDELDKAKATWSEGLAQFPDNAALKARLSRQGEELKAVIDDTYDVTKRVDTSLRELFAEQAATSK